MLSWAITFFVLALIADLTLAGAQRLSLPWSREA